MLKLIRLEWKKNNIGKYIRNASIVTAVLVLFIMAAAGDLEFDASKEVYGKSAINAAVEVFCHMSYMVFTAVMLSSFVVHSYESKTIHLMFSYPIKRQKILLSKMAAVWIFNFLALLISKLLIYSVLLLSEPYTKVNTASIQMGDLSFWLNLILGTAAMISISYIALLVGLHVRSSKATIVTSVILVCFTQGNIGAYSLADSVPFYMILLLLSIISVFLTVYRVEVKDV